MGRSPLSEFEELCRLVNFSALINSSLDIQTVLNQAMDYVEDLLEAEASSIFELDVEKGELFFRLARGEKSCAIREMRLKMGEGIAGAVALSEEPLLIMDTSKDPRFCHRFDEQSCFSSRSLLCVPLKSRERLIGVLEVVNKKDVRGFDQTDLEVLTLVGNLIGTALENARLYARLQDRLAATTDELKIAQAKLLRSERLAALGKLSQGVAHEVRNPVTIIGGFAHRLKKNFPLDAPQQEILTLIDAQVCKLERMVREIEAFTKLGEPVLHPTKLPALIDQVLASLGNDMTKKEIQVYQDFPECAPPVPLDPGLLSLALSNLMENAVEAMPPGGRLDIGLVVEPNRVHLTFKDTGAGISPADLAQVFDPFFSTKPQGTGMGLTLAYHVVASHLGELEIVSEPGRGTIVHVWLPRFRLE